jgi:isopenicillin-N epimerase
MAGPGERTGNAGLSSPEGTTPALEDSFFGMSRRDFLAKAGTAAALSALTPLSIATSPPAGAVAPGVDGVRDLFELDWSYIHMAGLLLASHPKPVAEAIERHRRALDQNPVFAWQEWNNKGEDEVREQAARYMNARAGDIALTGSTTMGLALLYNGIAIKPGQEILTTVHDHQATSQSIELRSRKTGVPVRRISLFQRAPEATLDEIVGRLQKEIRPETRVLAVTWVQSNTGLRLPIAEMAEIVAEANRGRSTEDRLLFCVDGVHGFGVEPLDMATFGCDFFSAGCHKWLFGPRGTGVLWGRPEVQEEASPTIPTFSGSNTWGRRMTPGGFHSFEHRWALGQAFELHLRLGPARVRQHIHALAQQCKEALAKMQHVRVHTPISPNLSSGLVCFSVDGLSPARVVAQLLEQRIIASTTPYVPSYPRLTPGLLNTPEEVERTLSIIAAMR